MYIKALHIDVGFLSDSNEANFQNAPMSNLEKITEIKNISVILVKNIRKNKLSYS